MELFHFPFNAMGTECELQFFAASKTLAQNAARYAIEDVRRLESRYSRYRDDSYLSEINRIAQRGGSLEVDDETAALLNYADACYRQSDGLFDITSGILRKIWRKELQQPPDKDTIERLLGQIGWHHVAWNAPTLEFATPGMEIDFGGIVKEYAVDRVAGFCNEQNILHGFVNLGGDLRIFGPRLDGSAWAVGIRHPRQTGLIRTLYLQRGALASSGDYERCFVLNGIRYGHVLNPKTGWPVNHLAAVSVISDLCVVAGSASTIAMLKEQEGPSWLEALGLPHLWFTVNGESGGSLALS
ncbi:MAG: FAD:protein FMN transferase [Methylomicrobium sp.]